jgi:hypothetical protein
MNQGLTLDATAAFLPAEGSAQAGGGANRMPLVHRSNSCPNTGDARFP